MKTKREGVRTGLRFVETVKRKFTEEELQRLGLHLAQKVQLMVENKSARVAAVADFTATHKRLEGEILALTDKRTKGFEEIDVECYPELDQPEPGKKQIVRSDTGEVIRTEKMTMAEMQGTFGFAEAIKQ